jgi:alkaline phosphatase
MMTGVKIAPWMIGVTGLSQGQCAPSPAHKLATLIEQAKDAGRAAGVATTDRITRPLAAAAYAHVSDTDWEVDTRMPAEALTSGCQDIARQLILFDHHGGLDVALGGGRLAFLRSEQVDPDQRERHGVRGDGDDLIVRWGRRNPLGHYVWTATELTKAASGSPGYLLGLFAPDAMTQDGSEANAGQPSLADMTRVAISVLGKSPKGYVLVVASEGEAERDAAAAAAKVADNRTLVVVATIRGPDVIDTDAYGPGAAQAKRSLDPVALHAILCGALGLPGAP